MYVYDAVHQAEEWLSKLYTETSLALKDPFKYKLNGGSCNHASKRRHDEKVPTVMINLLIFP